jgi:dTDP-4-dehydrorhamnose reductase
MRILILGGDGMLGHQLLRHFSAHHDTRVTLRQALEHYSRYGLFKSDNAYGAIDARSTDSLRKVLADFRPEAVINAIGLVKQRPVAQEAIPNIEINALLPHKVALLCMEVGARLVHMSTDCVFSGSRGCYREADRPDSDDLYGLSKLLGEVHAPHCITLRTSLIGPELSRKTGLLEWFLAQKGTVHGYRRTIFSGFTTIELSRIIEKILLQFPEGGGLYHVSSAPISKLDLLSLIKEKLNLPLQIIPDDRAHCDRSLDSTRFRADFGYEPPSWDTMLEELTKNILEQSNV